MVSANEALERLRAGNGRFVANRHEHQEHIGVTERTELTAGQSPFAVVLGCSDSRVPVEIILDQGLGDLFVIRVAGNITGATVIGSVEFAAAELGARLVVVLGHSKCGAIGTTLSQIEKPTDLTPGLQSIVDRISPVFTRLDAEGLSRDDLLKEAIRENVRSSADKMRQGSPILEDLIANDGLRVVGGSYDLLSGVVEFFDGVPLD
ncbi:TPA: carbonic anhydrase [Candidatus Latescibacteria bacterium]|nr:carbonic anhydrase [Candidatus Latescibacterota bacterium]